MVDETTEKRKFMYRNGVWISWWEWRILVLIYSVPELRNYDCNGREDENGYDLCYTVPTRSTNYDLRALPGLVDIFPNIPLPQEVIHYYSIIMSQKLGILSSGMDWFGFHSTSIAPFWFLKQCHSVTHCHWLMCFYWRLKDNNMP